MITDKLSLLKHKDKLANKLIKHFPYFNQQNALIKMQQNRS
jgi:hypothetical protein